jgi:uncharacterized membrane protein
MALLALACFAVIVHLFGAAVLPRRTSLDAWERAWLGAVVSCVVAEVVGLSFTLSSTLAALFGAALGYGHSLIGDAAITTSSRGRAFTTH